ncbi:SAM-dependent methyltransferase [Azoarcus olearius]|uniref:SAM-dependent methyltransferase n=1 Tax=Azoarcus sp. (strain BH72) TaxID=418699 RepID=A1K5Y0_AZOSB|nr:SAM-dependent methyltransferase [Azoarcus olearius]CAL94235.1 conserved hypothetical protein [Azoarcus olearius]
MTTPGRLLLIPVGLGGDAWPDFLPARTQATAAALRYFVVENARAARAHLKTMGHPLPLRDVAIHELPEQCAAAALDELLAPARAGQDIGLMSDAGCPAVADPGSRLVARAHDLGIPVMPLVGPSSILLGLMGSGLNGQSFAFHGYLPVAESERDLRIRGLEEESRRQNRTQIFIETPYRNERMFDALLRLCHPQTRLCIACDLTTPTEYLVTHRIETWRTTPRPQLAKRPALFLLLAAASR